MGKGKQPLAKRAPTPPNVVVPFPAAKPIQASTVDEPPFQVFKFRLRSSFVEELVLPTKEFDRLWYRAQEPDE
jgi:hypothetical protein